MLARFIMLSGDIFMKGIVEGGGAALLVDGNESDMGGPPWGACGGRIFLLAGGTLWGCGGGLALKGIGPPFPPPPVPLLPLAPAPTPPPLGPFDKNLFWTACIPALVRSMVAS